MTANEDKLLKEYLNDKKKIIDEALNRYLPDENEYPQEIFRAMRYSLFAGGKRIRPILCMASAEAVGGEVSAVIPVSCALELIHTYSLIHDDLPAMDDDDFRRGVPTNHKVFGEGIAILAGDALLTEAYRLMSDRGISKAAAPEKMLAVINEISKAAGYFGMVGGQVVDILSEGREVDTDTLYYIHTKKTGEMIRVSLRVGAILSGAKKSYLDALSIYGDHIGLAFQIADDILNVEGDRKLMGKGTGSDAERGKVTFPKLIGLEASKKKLEELIEKSVDALSGFDEKAKPLRMIAKYIIKRES